MAAALESDDPVIFFEPILKYFTKEADIPTEHFVVPIGKARIAREGTDVTVVSYGNGAGISETAAGLLADENISVEVIDLRTLKPWDEDCVLKSVEKTGRLVVVHEAAKSAGFGAEIIATVMEKAGLLTRNAAAQGLPRRYAMGGCQARALLVDFTGTGRRRRPQSPGGLSMAKEFRLPDLGSGLQEGQIVNWLVEVGQAVTTSDDLCEVETEKAVIEIPVPYTGTVLELKASAGDSVEVGSVIAVFGEAGESAGDDEAMSARR